MMPTFHVGSPSSQLRSLAKVAVIPLHDFKHRSGGRWTAGCQQSKPKWWIRRRTCSWDSLERPDGTVDQLRGWPSSQGTQL